MWFSLLIESFRSPESSRYLTHESDDLVDSDSTGKLVSGENALDEFSKFTPLKPLEIWYRNFK